MEFFFTLQLSVISIAPVYASQSFFLATTGTSNKAVTDELFEVLQRKGTTSDDIIALIAKGADINAKDGLSGNTPLVWAAAKGRADLCLTIISQGSDVNAKNEYSSTPLMWAAGTGLVGVCLALINNGANVNAIDEKGWTPVIWAACNQKRDICILLLRHMLLQQLLTVDSEEGNLATRKMRMLCAIMALKRINFNKNLIALIIKSKPLMYDYTACRYNTYCCRFLLHEYHHAITKEQLSDLLGQDNIDELKANMQYAYDACTSYHTVLKNLLNPINFDEHFDELFLNYMPSQPTI